MNPNYEKVRIKWRREPKPIYNGQWIDFGFTMALTPLEKNRYFFLKKSV